MDWRADALRRGLEPLLPGLRVEVVAETASTNTDLLQRVRAADPAGFEPCLLVAEQQSHGRGRLGRYWHSAPGASLTFSLALPLAASDWSGLSLAVGVALADALEPRDETGAGDGGDAAGAASIAEVAGAARAPRIGLKWPNDLWLVRPDPRAGGAGWRDAARRSRASGASGAVFGGEAAIPGASALPGRKLGGILIETVATGATRLAVIGVGLNIRPLVQRAAAASEDREAGRGGMAEVGMPGMSSPAVEAGDPATRDPGRSSRAPELTSGYACLQEIDPRADAPAVLERVAPALLRALQHFERDGFGAFRARYAARDLLRGRAVTTTQPGVPAGIAQGVAGDGCLLLQASGTLQRIASGEVSVRVADAAPRATAA